MFRYRRPSGAFQTIVSLSNTSVGVGQLAGFRFLTDPPPPLPPGFSIDQLAVGGFGRINDPDVSEPYVQKFSLGFETTLSKNTTLSSDFVHTLGLNEPRVQVINPRIRNICDPLFPTRTRRRRSASAASAPYARPPFVDAASRPIALRRSIDRTTNRSLFDSWATTLRHRTRRMLFRPATSFERALVGRPAARSYSGNGVATTPTTSSRTTSTARRA